MEHCVTSVIGTKIHVSDMLEHVKNTSGKIHKKQGNSPCFWDGEPGGQVGRSERETSYSLELSIFQRKIINVSSILSS